MTGQKINVTVVDDACNYTVPKECVLPFAVWRALGTRLFGPDMGKWRWKCPRCSAVSTPDGWIAVGRSPAEAYRAPTECLKRAGSMARMRRPMTDEECDWCSWGLFAGPWFVVHQDAVAVEGKVARGNCTPCFPFDGVTAADLSAVLAAVQT